MYPFVILAVGLAIVILGIVALRVNAFLALITAAMVVSIMAPGEWSTKSARVAEAFGDTAASVGIVIALAAVIGRAMLESGAADRIVLFFLTLFGEKRAASALMASGFTLAIPVFFDTVFYLLVPLARSMYRKVGHSYVKYLMAIGVSAVAHALVPPTPGPLIVASAFNIDLGVMIMMGLVVAIPAAIAGLAFANWSNSRMEITMRTLGEAFQEKEPLPDEQLPNLLLALAPIVLPLVLIGSHTALSAWSESRPEADMAAVLSVTAFAGNPNFALLISAAIAVYTQVLVRRPSRAELSVSIEQALMSGGIIILITVAGGAFGAMLKAAGLAGAIKDAFGESSTSGLLLLLLAFLVSSLLKFAQGSTTAAMIVSSQMFAAMIEPQSLGFHPVYLALAIGSGGLMGSWMNDSGFWIYAKMGGLTETETLCTWTPLLIVLGGTAMLGTLLLASVLPQPFPTG